MVESQTPLATQCLEFCQALERQGKDFKLSITIGSTFTFSLDSRVGKATLPKKGKEEEKPIYPQKECQTQRRVSGQKVHFYFCGDWSGILPEAFEAEWRLSVWPVWCKLHNCEGFENSQGEITQGSIPTRNVERIILPTLSLCVPHKGPEQNGILPQLWQGNVSHPSLPRWSWFNIGWCEYLWMWLWIWFWSLPCPTPQTFWMCKKLQDLLECTDAIANGEPDEGFEGYSDLNATYGRGSQLPTFIHHVTNMYQSSPMSL